ncbi:MAG: TldD/PmbA family protein [Phycisphaerae bacterium]
MSDFDKDFEAVEKRFRKLVPAVDFCSLRVAGEDDEVLTVRQDVPEPAYRATDVGAMATVIHKGALGYAATSDLSAAGLKRAIGQAVRWAKAAEGRCVVDFTKVAMPSPVGQYIGPEQVPWSSVPVEDKFALLARECKRLKTDDRIVDWETSLWHTDSRTLYLTSAGGRAYQKFSYLCPMMLVRANKGANTQRRTLGSERGLCRQAGMELLDQIGYYSAAEWIPAEALELLDAPNCPSGKMDLLIAPDQMILQIHESIGHPLELDRILGDERNYAGTSFVRPEMIGTYRYGSDLLNITFDPSRPEQLATYAYDDDGLPAKKEFLIERGILKRVLGGVTSQARSGQPGVANSRACSWNRPPIDRMANLNLEVGTSSLDEMIAAVKRGVYVKSNCSWSIDDSRNKFQFGCEWGRLIEDGKLTKVVRNPNYRGISATFWRSLKMVGDQSTHDVMGTPNCGKGEPNQVIRVAHASPACLFADVEVFGGAA